MASCKSCEASITWAKSAAGKAMPLELDAAGTWVIVDGVARQLEIGDEGPFYKSHFASCPQASSWRRKK